MHRLTLIYVWMFLSGIVHAQNQKEITSLAERAEISLEKGIAFIRTLAIEGGYVYHYTLDGKEKWGEGKTNDRTIEVQPPGTPAVGLSFLRAYNISGNKKFLEAAENAAEALIKGQNKPGGWDHKIYFDQPPSKIVSFDDDQTQTAISFLMALDQVSHLAGLKEAVEKALNLMMMSQLENGGWPHKYPMQGNYHDFATFNDEGINDCIRVMLEADSYYHKPEIAKSLKKAGRFLMISQLPPPQPGWAQQYNEYLQPAWARTFEPPSVCPAVTVNNINSLIDLYEHTGRHEYLEPIPDALRWLEQSQLPNGKWGRFLEIGTNKPLYYDRGRIRVNSVEELSLERRTGYGYETDIKNKIDAAKNRYHIIIDKKSKSPDISAEQKVKELIPEVENVLKSQDELGRWIVRNDKFRKGTPGYNWNGEYRVEDRISTALFNRNINILCNFLEEYKNEKF